MLSWALQQGLSADPSIKKRHRMPRAGNLRVEGITPSIPAIFEN